MEQLSFGEQLKVILSRRGMTIKALAELIEEHTGKKMSRQNLTQRLGRDNFQEQDMRMIAEILGCPFTLNILAAEEGLIGEQEELVFQEKGTEKKAEKKVLVPKVISAQEGPRGLLEEKLDEKEDDLAVLEEETEEMGDDLELLEGEADEMDDSPELLEEEMDEIEGSDELLEESDEIEEEEDWEDSGEPIEDEHFITVGDLRDMNQELTDLEKEENFRAKGIFLRVKGVDVDQEQIEQERREERAKGRGLSQDTQEIIKRTDLRVEEAKAEEAKAEEVPQGEINPYTGKEYETNSVRTHPTRIGYVQVYDRGIHRWKDMTEWAFLGYQERKKAILGSRYEEPIYLD